MVHCKTVFYTQNSCPSVRSSPPRLAGGIQPLCRRPAHPKKLILFVLIIALGFPPYSHHSDQPASDLARYEQPSKQSSHVFS